MRRGSQAGVEDAKCHTFPSHRRHGLLSSNKTFFFGDCHYL
jgi:hypothetical protein